MIRLTLTLNSSFVGYFFVPGPLGGLKSVSRVIFGHTDLIGNFSINICISSKNLGLAHGFWPKMTKFSSRHFLLFYVPKDLGVLKQSIRNLFEVERTPS